MSMMVPNADYDLPIFVISPGSQPNLVVSPCPVCDAGEAIPRFQLDASLLQLVVCPDCGLGRLWPPPTSEVIASFYSQKYYGEGGAKFGTFAESLLRLVATRRANFLARQLPSGGRVLEIGCGRGILLETLVNRGFEVHGVELHEQAFQGIDPRVKQHVSETLSDLHFPAGHFDEVIIWHVLEHLPDPRGTVREIRRILKPGGVMVVAVPNFASWQSRWSKNAWFHLDLPRHLFHFPVESLKRLITREGLHCTGTHHFSLRQNPFGWLQSALNRWSWLPRNGLYVLLQRRPAGEPPPFCFRTRCLLWLVWWAGIPEALAVSIVEAVFCRGATVHIVARAPLVEQVECLE